MQRLFNNSKSILKKYTKDKDKSFYEVNYAFLKGYEAFLFKQGNSGGGIHHHMRTLRTVFNEAIRRDYVEAAYYPFLTQFNKNGYSLAHLKSTASPRALSESDLEKLKVFDTDNHPHLMYSHAYFMFRYYARGMNFGDMAQLKWEDIYDDRLVYNRSKTSKPYNIKLSQALQDFLQLFKGSINEYVFPVLSEIHVTEKQKRYRIKKCLKAYYEDLKDIATILKIKINLTSYVARHTYATTLKRNGFSTDIISEALGHSEMATTKAYLEKFSNDKIDAADEML